MATEKRLIDAGNLWSDIMMLPHNGDMISSEEVEQAIKEAPTVDAVEVVRCEDCTQWVEGRHHTGRCNALIGFHGADRYTTGHDHFCSYGERRSDGNL